MIRERVITAFMKARGDRKITLGILMPGFSRRGGITEDEN